MNFISNNKFNVSRIETTFYQQYYNYDLYYLFNDQSLQNLCHKNISICFISLLAAGISDDQVSSFNNNFEILYQSSQLIRNNTLSEYDKIEMGWINITCQFSLKSQLESLTQLNLKEDFQIAIFPRSNRLSVFNSDFTLDNLTQFILQIINNEKPTIKYNSLNDFHLYQINNCFKINNDSNIFQEDKIDNISVEKDFLDSLISLYNKRIMEVVKNNYLYAYNYFKKLLN